MVTPTILRKKPAVVARDAAGYSTAHDLLASCTATNKPEQETMASRSHNLNVQHSVLSGNSSSISTPKTSVNARVITQVGPVSGNAACSAANAAAIQWSGSRKQTLVSAMPCRSQRGLRMLEPITSALRVDLTSAESHPFANLLTSTRLEALCRTSQSHPVLGSPNVILARMFTRWD